MPSDPSPSPSRSQVATRREEVLSALREFGSLIRSYKGVSDDEWRQRLTSFFTWVTTNEHAHVLVRELIAYNRGQESNMEDFLGQQEPIRTIFSEMEGEVERLNLLDKSEKLLELSRELRIYNYESDQLWSNALNYFRKRKLGAEQKEQPSKLKEGVKPDDISVSQALDKLIAAGISDETRQRVAAEVRYAHKPRWNIPRENQLPDLRGLTAIEFLRKVWASEIVRWGNKVYVRSVRLHDSALADAVSRYASNRKARDQDRGGAKGVTFVKGLEPPEQQPERPTAEQTPHLKRAGLRKTNNSPG